MDVQPVVYLLDDEEPVVVAIGRLLQGEGFEVRAFTSATDFLKSHDPDVPGCLICDVLMPQMSGLQLQRALVTSGSNRPIIMITGQGDIPMTVQAMKAGAVSFLAKPLRRADLVAAVREAIDKDLAARALQTEQRTIRNRLESLTPRERQVLALVTTGMLNKQIAAELGAAEKTIKVHRGRVMVKMQVRSAAALVHMLSRDSSFAQYANGQAEGPSHGYVPHENGREGFEQQAGAT
jgi:FixJ family two-component response regulator